MSTRKHRALADLYNVTPTLLKPKITPVLSGSYRMQGPLYEADHDFQANTVSCQVDQESDSCSKNLNIAVRVESGKCNVCSFPCSSCLPIQQALMGSKRGELTGETTMGNALSCSVNDVPTTKKSRKGETGQHTETGDVLSVTSSCDSFSENAKWKASSRISDVTAASENVSLHQKVECSRGSEVLDGSMSCVVSTDKHSISSKSSDRNGGGIGLLCCPASTSSLLPKGYAKEPNEWTSLVCMDKNCDAEGVQECSGWRSRSCEVSSGKVPPSTSSATDLSSQNPGMMQISFPKNKNEANPSMKEAKSIPQEPISNELEGESCAPLQGQLLEYRDEHLNLLFTKEVVSDVPYGYPPADASKEENEDVDKLKKSSVLPDTRDSSQFHSMDESDDSQIVEQDVKVCDICGDAGREDLLAICCRCTDGAEHTYCMREMLDKVPEGDWTCEECKYDEEMKNQRQEKMVTAEGNEKYSSSRKSSGGNSNVCLTSEPKVVDDVVAISKDHSHMEILGKRRRDDIEVSSSAKKQAVEPSLGSVKKSSSSSVASLSRDNSSSPSSVASLSRDNSFRHMEKGKEKLSHQSSSGALVVSDDPESVRAPATGPRKQAPRGTFLKSNSFSSLNVKPKVKHVDEDIPPKLKMAREPSPLDLKEGIGKSLGKSMSFRTMSSGRLATAEAKVKLLSPSFSHNQDNKGPKHTKARSLLERKSSFRPERSFNLPRIGSTISILKSDQKPVCRGENALSSISNNRQSKAVQSDSKSSTVSKTSNLVFRRSSDTSVSVGEVKRQSALANGCSSSEQKPSPKYEPLSISYVAEKPTCNSNEILADGMSCPRESANFGEKTWDNGGRTKQNVAVGGRTEICQKCKEVGHLMQFCTVEGLPSDFCAAKSPREETNGSNDLKAAIEVARLRKPGICRNHRVSDKSSDLSLTSKNDEVGSQDQSSCSSIKKNVSSREVNEGHTTSLYNTDSCRQTAIDNAKQYKTETSTSRTGDGGDVPLDGNTSIRDWSSHFPAAIPVFWKVLSIPEHEFIWQGNFEVHRTVKVEFCDGIQAHLSTRASPKVLGAVNKFPHKIVLNEVPRLSTWPIRFQEFGVREDNIALYFFAKDVDSYEKSYKNLLEQMIKNDLALKGTVDGVELLIFPSTQLPEKSQRWNMLFFLWGVFRGKKASCLQQMPGSPKQLLALGDIPTAIMSLPENICSVGPIVKDLSSVAAIVAEVPVSIDGDGASGLPSLTQAGVYQQMNLAQQDGGVNSNSLSTLQSRSTKSCKEIRCTDTPLETGAESNCRLETREVQASVLAPGRTVSTRNERKTVQRDTSLGTLEMASSGSKTKGNMSNKMSNSAYQVNHGINLGDETAREEAHMGRDTKLAPEDYMGMISSDAASAGTSQSRKVDYDDRDEDAIVVGTIDSFALQRHGVASGSHVMKIGGKACGEETPPHSETGNAERYFFPVDPHPGKEEEDIGLVEKSMMPWKMHLLEDEVHERTPNLELALGGDMKLEGIPSFLVSKIEEDKKVNKEHHSEKVVEEEREDDITALLSLSLSFPFPEKEKEYGGIYSKNLMR